MRDFESTTLLNVNVSVVLSAMFLVSGTANANFNRLHLIGRETQLQRLADPETRAYREWYRVFRDRKLKKVIDLGESYLEVYPDGKYEGFIRRIIEFARVSLSPDQRRRAASLRSQVTASLADNSVQLGALLRDVLSGQLEVDTKSPTGATALMFAAANGDREAVKALINRHANIDATENTHGWSALIYAVWRGDPFVVRYFLEFYPDAGVKDKEGRTALDHAKATCDFEIMLLINGRPLKGQHT